MKQTKQTLHDFALYRAGATKAQLESEFGELLLYLLRLADRLDVDLFAAADKLIEQRAACSLVLVPNEPGPGDPPKS